MPKQLDKAGHHDVCTRCGVGLYGGAVRWLELDRRNGVYHDPGEIPIEASQGAFPFGLKCAKAQLGKPGL